MDRSWGTLQRLLRGTVFLDSCMSLIRERMDWIMGVRDPDSFNKVTLLVPYA